VEFRLKTGTIESTLDDKGRVVIPAPFREYYPGKLVITQGKEECVWVMKEATYQKFLSRFKEKCKEENLSFEEIEAFKYQHESTAFSVEIDPKTGRIPIPAFLRSYANLTKDCLVVSVDNHLEIWNADNNKKFMEEVRILSKNALRKFDAKVNLFSDEGEE
jgi:MraZ protein